MRKPSGITGWTTTVLAVSIIGVCTLGSLPKPAAAQTSGSSPVIYLDQAWSQGDREWYYQFSQGSTVLSYDIFLNLEVAGGQELFRSDANSDRYGLIPQPANPNTNPDGLPIGLVQLPTLRSPTVSGAEEAPTPAIKVPPTGAAKSPS